MKFDRDLCLNLRYDFGKMSSTLGSVVPLAMFFVLTSHVANVSPSAHNENCASKADVSLMNSGVQISPSTMET